jgi:hypothetical protein
LWLKDQSWDLKKKKSQGFELARQVLYQLSIHSALFALVIFRSRVSLFDQASMDHYLPILGFPL